MGILFDKLVAFFTKEEWDYQLLENRDIVRVGFSGENGNWSCIAQAREPQQQFVMYSICPLRIPVDRRSAMAEFLIRANYGLVIGNFEMDYDDGEVRYKTSLDVEEMEDLAGPMDTAEDAGPTFVLLRHIVYANVAAMDRYLPGILAVLAGSQTPAEAVERIDESREPDLSRS